MITIFTWFSSLHIFASISLILHNPHSFFHQFHRILSLPFILSPIQSDIVGNRKVGAVFFPWLNEIFTCFDSLHILNALTFILHHYNLSLRRFNRIFSETARYSIIYIFSQFGIYKDLLKNGYIQGTKTWTCICSVLNFEVDLVHLLSTSLNSSLDSELPYPIEILRLPRHWESCWVCLIGDIISWIRTGVISLNTFLFSILHFLFQKSIGNHPERELAA